MPWKLSSQSMTYWQPDFANRSVKFVTRAQSVFKRYKDSWWPIVIVYAFYFHNNWQKEKCFHPSLGVKFQRNCTEPNRRFTRFKVFGFRLCSRHIATFALSGDFSPGVVRLPKFSIFVVLTSHSWAESFTPNCLKLSKFFRRTGNFDQI